MQQHAVPQNVTQYQFRLVGDMTLKQFLELLGGIIGAYLFYSSNLIFIFKWPLALLTLLGGFALAFFPLEDRPLDQWIVNFLKSIYAPTRFIWKKSNKVPSIFTFEPHKVAEVVTATKTVKAPSLSDLQPSATNDVSDEERQRLNVLDAMLAKMPVVQKTQDSPQSQPIPVKPTITVHKLKPITKLQTETIFQSAPRPSPAPKQIDLTSSNVAIPTAAPQSVITPKSEQPVVAKPQETVIVARPTVSQSTTLQPTTVPGSVNLPASPKSPNLVVGMVVDKANKIIENAIVQIVTTDGVPARAMKTNSLGQFYTSTPLTAGEYTLEVEKEGLTFPINKLIIDNKLISPLLLRAT